jgi:hypothetical protein
MPKEETCDKTGMSSGPGFVSIPLYLWEAIDMLTMPCLVCKNSKKLQPFTLHIKGAKAIATVKVHELMPKQEREKDNDQKLKQNSPLRLDYHAEAQKPHFWNGMALSYMYRNKQTHTLYHTQFMNYRSRRLTRQSAQRRLSSPRWLTH